MNEFCELYWRLDSTTKTNEKVAAIRDYLAVAEPADAIWAINLLVGNRIKRLVKTGLLRKWAAQQSGVATWLFDECYDRVGDLAETISLILPLATTHDTTPSLHRLIEDELLTLRDCEPSEQETRVVSLWNRFDQRQRFVLGKLMMGGFRVGVSKGLVVRAIAAHAELETATISHRLMGEWQPTTAFYQHLIDPDENETAISKPYPFFLANPLKEEPDSLGEPSEWVAEWKWDGIRAQLIRRERETFIWSRGEDLVTDQFPEIANTAQQLPCGTVIDGEILGWDESKNMPLEFAQLQRRLGRKRLGRKVLGEVPVVLLVFDLIENDGVDLRETPLIERQRQLKDLLSSLDAQEERQDGELFATVPDDASRVAIRPQLDVLDKAENFTWSQLAEIRSTSKSVRAEGLMLKRKSSKYQVGRPVGDWWKWKVDPYTIDAVLVYAQRGHGRRAGLYTDFTFAVWQGDQLVPFAKAYSGLTDAEIRKVDAFVRKNTKEKFGPVHSVLPELVFELAFENIQRSTRHKSGVSVRFPRISRWRHDKKPADADSLKTILSLLEQV
ncbi:MAG: ATP-dependent DNA ligase [Planctomycetota bacterium]